MMRLIVVLVTYMACKLQVTQLPIGTRVPMDELYLQRADIEGYIQSELDAKHGARAFYALELVKTRPYAVESLATRDPIGDKPAVTDLRPVLLATMEKSDPDARGLILVDTTAAVAQRQQSDDVAFWAHMRQFEKRTASLNANTLGIPYDYAARTGYGVSTAEEVGRLFGPDEAFLSYFVQADRVTVFAIVRNVLHVRQIAMRATELRDRVQRFVRLVRAPPQPGSEQAWLGEARALQRALLEPLEPVLGDKIAGLFISQHGFLSNLPFGLLVDAHDHALLETKRVTYVPSASIYRQLLSRPILNRPPHMLAVGNAIYPDGVAALTFAAKEARAVSEIFKGGLLLREEAATEARVSDLAPKYNILHFATHGVLLGNVVPGGSSLLVTADAEHDGFLSAAEIARLDLSHSYIAVLSACETAVSEQDGRSIDLGTITNAFLTAGAPSVLGTMWQVDDAATTVLMLAFYTQFLEVGAGEALRRAQLALRKDPRFAHPYFWGAFALYGWDK